MRGPLSRRHLLAALATLGTAGCLDLESSEETTAGPGTASGTGTPRATATAGETPSATATAEGTAEPTEEPTATPEPSVSYPLGVAEDGVSGALADTHHGVALEQSFTLSYAVDPGSAPVRATDRTHRHAPGDGGTEVRFNDDRARRHQYRSDGRTYARVREGDATAYFVSRLGLRERTLTMADDLKPVLTGGAFRPTGTHPTATPKTIDIGADGVADAAALRTAFALDDVAGLSGEGVVRESGLIESLTTSFDGSRGGTSGRVTVETTVDDVGATTVDPPDWLSAARERAPAFELGVADDVLTLANGGGGPLPADASVLVATADGTTVRGQTVDPVPVDGTLYLAVSPSGSDLSLAVGDPPGGDRATLSSEVRTRVTYRGVGAFEGTVTP